MAAGAAGAEVGLRTASLALAGLLLFMVVTLAVNRQDQWRAFRIVVHPDAVQTMRWPAHYDVLIRANEISKVEVVPERGLTIRGASRHQRIAIPAELERYGELRELVAGWRRPEIVRPRPIEGRLPGSRPASLRFCSGGRCRRRPGPSP